MNLPNTAIFKRDNETVVKLYATEIVRFTSNLITLNTEGFNTATTARRMNAIAETFGLGYRVGYKQRKPYAVYKGMTLFFENNVVMLNRKTGETKTAQIDRLLRDVSSYSITL